VLGRQRSADRFKFKRILNTMVLRMWRKMKLRREHENKGNVTLRCVDFPGVRATSSLVEIFDEKTGGCADEGSGRGCHERGQGL